MHEKQGFNILCSSYLRNSNPIVKFKCVLLYWIAMLKMIICVQFRPCSWNTFTRVDDGHCELFTSFMLTVQWKAFIYCFFFACVIIFGDSFVGNGTFKWFCRSVHWGEFSKHGVYTTIIWECSLCLKMNSYVESFQSQHSWTIVRLNSWVDYFHTTRIIWIEHAQSWVLIEILNCMAEKFLLLISFASVLAGYN